jgi:outer membrane protein OmpA-like peptidoglycan-associated protein
VLLVLSACETIPATRVVLEESEIVKTLKGCPVYEEEVAFPSVQQAASVVAADPAPEPKPPEPEVEAASNDLDRVFNAVQKEFEDSGLKLEKFASGFRDRGLSVEKKKGPDGKVTREILISIDGDVSFAHGSSNLTARAQELVEKVGKAMAEYPNTKARISGHTDSTGPFKLNKWLSLERARSVKTALVKKHNLAESRILEVEGYADTRKIVDTMRSEPRNRRVEIRVVFDD